ncbi:hypothetical protein J5N97_026126 [Dioscorea zingiberensis]|uniref:DUF547 domain-containing protein n=1 Tax=Dioscorea zingiberensis TaxID=325984 RepID=A0A9D5C2E8_9LILI|nr:hypothetical protein J5N97_026126 [Dioscorea zingiberensis]
MAVSLTPFSSTPQQRHSKSVTDLDNTPNVSQDSPQLSHYNHNICILGRQHDKSFSSNEEMVVGCSIQKPTAEVVTEIAALEREIINLERYLLSLYRSAFNQCHANSAAIINKSSPLEFNKESEKLGEVLHANYYQEFGRRNLSHRYHGIKKNRAADNKQIENSPVHDLASASDKPNVPFSREAKIDMKRSMSGHRSLADHLGTSLVEHVNAKSCRLSEDIVRCIAAIYCKLANPPMQQTRLLNSPTPSVSPSSSFSQQNASDNWSPRYNFDVASSPLQFESPIDESSSYASMIDISKITVDGDRFDYASKMLSIFRSLIQQLETVNPTKMNYEEQLAFWINIHNALVMHAFLAYGLHQRQMKSSSLSILKAAYDVGGCSINAYDIQSSILRSQSHRSAVWLHVIFSPPTMKFMKGHDKHRYALDHPEPLAHFALSLGAYSDPGVRVYTSKGVIQELKLAKEEYIQANVSVRKGKKITMPKLLHYYAKDANLQLSDLLEMVSNCMPETQQKIMRGCLKGRPEKCVEWSSYKSAFRYLVHRELAKQ